MSNINSNSTDLHVIFGTGPLGQSVMRELLSRGKRIRMVNRSGKADVPSNVEVVAGNAYDVANNTSATKGAAVVYQCAQPAYHEWTTKFMPLQSAILDAVAANGAKFIVAENLYMFGAVDGPIREDLPYNAHTRKGQVRQKMTEALFAAHQSGKVRVATARGSDFFGPAVLQSSVGERAIYPALAGKAASMLGKLDEPHTMTYINDFGKTLVILGERDDALGQAWNVPNAETLTQRQFIGLIFEELGQPAKISTANKLMVQLFGIFSPGAREMVEMYYEFDRPFIVDSSKAEKAFGQRATPLRQAIKDTVDWFRQHPQVKH